MFPESLRGVFVWPGENREPGESDHQDNGENTNRKKKMVLLDTVVSILATLGKNSLDLFICRGQKKIASFKVLQFSSGHIICFVKIW